MAGFESLGDLAMLRSHARGRAPSQRGVLKQRVAERVARLNRAVRPALGSLVPQELALVR